MNRLIVSSFIDELEKLGSLGFGKGIPLAVKSSVPGQAPTGADVIRTIKDSLKMWTEGIEGQAAMQRMGEHSAVRVRAAHPWHSDPVRLAQILKEEGAISPVGALDVSARGMLPRRVFPPSQSSTATTLPSTGILAPSGPIKIKQVG